MQGIYKDVRRRMKRLRAKHLDLLQLEPHLCGGLVYLFPVKRLVCRSPFREPFYHFGTCQKLSEDRHAYCVYPAARLMSQASSFKRGRLALAHRNDSRAEDRSAEGDEGRENGSFHSMSLGPDSAEGSADEP